MCQGIEDFYLCQKHYNGEIESELWFETEIENYKKSLQQEGQQEEKEIGIIEKMTKYVKDNPIVLIIGLVMFVLILIVVINKIKTNKKKIKINLDLK